MFVSTVTNQSRKFHTGFVETYRYGFNGKENDPETGTQDYGARIYDSRIVRFLSVDPLFETYPHYSSYQFAGNKPIKFIDLDGEEEKDPTFRFYKTNPQLDMKDAPAGSAKNAAGYARNGPWFWRQQLKLKPELFTPENKVLIKGGKSPIVNEKWVAFNPGDAEYVGGKLVHHHIDGKNVAVGIPEKVHTDNFKELHPFLKGTLGKSLGVLGTFGDFIGFFAGNPNSMITMFQCVGCKPEDKIGQVIKDWDSGLYATITNVTINKDEKGVLTNRVISYDVYESSGYDEKEGKYIGVNKVETVTETINYDSDGKAKSSTKSSDANEL